MAYVAELPFSVLDLVPIHSGGGGVSEAFRNAVSLARHVEALGYKRFWVAEHHNIASVASAATAVVIAHLAAHTKTIRVGSGGIMLPNHAPLVIAEQFGTLEALHPGRIDLGLGRAPGGDPLTARALRRNLGGNGDTFPRDLLELMHYFHPPEDTRGSVRAIPGEGLDVPIYLLGSSTFSAQLAAEVGLPFAFASHFAPDYLMHALQSYRANFKPSRWLDRPHAMVTVNLFAADTDAAARRLFTSLQQAFVNLIRGTPGPIPAPVDDMADLWSGTERDHVARMTAVSAVGSKATVRRALERVIDVTEADELIFTSQVHNAVARHYSFELAAEAMKEINAGRCLSVSTADPVATTHVGKP